MPKFEYISEFFVLGDLLRTLFGYHRMGNHYIGMFSKDSPVLPFEFFKKY